MIEVGAAEVARVLDTSRQHVGELVVSRSDFPAPLLDKDGDRTWDRASIEQWAANNQDRGPRYRPIDPRVINTSIRDTVVLAFEEARIYNDGFVGAPHLFLATLRSDPLGTISGVTESIHAFVEKARGIVQDSISLHKRECRPEDLTLAIGGQNVLHSARFEAAALRDEEVLTYHLLLALISNERELPARVLSQLGVVPAVLKSRLLAASERSRA